YPSSTITATRTRPLDMAWGDLPVEGQTLEPLGSGLRTGLMTVTVLAFISFFSSTVLFSYLVYKLAVWRFFIRNQPDGHIQHHFGPLQRSVDFTLGIGGIFNENDPNDNGVVQSAEAGQAPGAQYKRKRPNQFLILIINLFLADMHQGVAFFLNIEWVRQDAIVVGTATCFTQGLFVSLGDLASSMFITTIATHTYLCVVLRRKIPQKSLYIAIAAIWVFVYAVSFGPIAWTRGGVEYGGFFVRAGSWCWINRRYETLRLVTHYLFIFMALVATSTLYFIIFSSIRRQARSGSIPKYDDGDSTKLQLSRNPAFLIYPVIYVLCTSPLALGRIATMAGASVPNSYFCFAGAIIGCNGLFDCLLFGSTRNGIVFASKYDVDSDELGLGTFAFLQKRESRRFGNTISIQGGHPLQTPDITTSGKWWMLPGQPSGPERRTRKTMGRTVSQESLRGPTIQMDTITSVVVEVDETVERDPRYPNPLPTRNTSITSCEKHYEKVIERTLMDK
ncbi:hypothetical protein FZEAL_9055, partial [Fusarium zealandicum]